MQASKGDTKLPNELSARSWEEIPPEAGFIEMGPPSVSLTDPTIPDVLPLDVSPIYEAIYRRWRGLGSGDDDPPAEDASSASPDAEPEDPRAGRDLADLRKEHRRIRKMLEADLLTPAKASALTRSLAEEAKLLKPREGQEDEGREGIPMEILRTVARTSPEALNALAPLLSQDQIARLLQGLDGDD